MNWIGTKCELAETWQREATRCRREAAGTTPHKALLIEKAATLESCTIDLLNWTEKS